MSPANATEGKFGARFYTWKGQQFHSVTTTINKGIPKYLVPWASKLVAEYAYDHRDEWSQMGRESAVGLLKDVPNRARDSAANIGKDVHAAVEAHVLGRPMPPWTPDIAPRMRAVERFLLDFDPEYQATEASVYSRRYSFAGTGDAWLTCRRSALAGKPLIVDYKSGKSVYAEVAIQLSAYARGEFIASPDGETELPLPVVEGGAVLHITDSGAVLREVDISDEVFAFFRHAQRIHRWADEASKSVLGDPVMPTLEEQLAASLDRRAVA